MIMETCVPGRLIVLERDDPSDQGSIPKTIFCARADIDEFRRKGLVASSVALRDHDPLYYLWWLEKLILAEEQV